MFADDTKVINSSDDQHILQDDFDYLTSWCSKWLLIFHPDKCKLMQNVEQEYAYNLNVDNTAHQLGKIEEEKDIVVIIDLKLEFYRHIRHKK